MQVLRNNHSAGDSDDLEDRAEISRPKSNWKGERNGKRGGARQEKHKRTNWYHPFLFSIIDRTACLVGWSPQSIVNRLSLDHPRLFRDLNRGTVYKWIDKDTKRDWSAKTKQNVERRHALAGSGQTGILAGYPEIVEEIVKQLKGLRTASLPINVVIVRGIMLAVIEDKQPDLLLKFKCSEVSSIPSGNHIMSCIHILYSPTSGLS